MGTYEVLNQFQFPEFLVHMEYLLRIIVASARMQLWRVGRR